MDQYKSLPPKDEKKPVYLLKVVIYFIFLLIE